MILPPEVESLAWALGTPKAPRLDDTLMSTPSNGNKWVVADEGAAVVEYAIMVALIALVVIGAATTLGQSINTFFTNVAGMLP